MVRSARSAPTLTGARSGGGCCGDRCGAGERLFVRPRRALCADDRYASGRGGIAARRMPRFTEMRDESHDLYQAEGSLCRQRSSRPKPSTVPPMVMEGMPPADELFNMNVENYQSSATTPGDYSMPSPRRNNGRKTLCLPSSVHCCPRLPYPTRPAITYWALASFGGSGTARLSRGHSYGQIPPDKVRSCSWVVRDLTLQDQ